ncbi:MAG TPA: alpha/beta hydrolase family protein, partial [Candidatus Eisenbacteria bacterium]
ALGARGVAVLALAALAVAAASGPARAAGIPPGKVLRLRIPAPSLHRDDQSVRVYLPPSYDRPEAASRRYPLIVMLHGWPGGDGNWLGQGHAAETLDSMIVNRSIPEVIALFPNANGVGILGRSFYLNAHDGSFDIQDFLTQDLIAWADSAYRTRRDPADRALVGLSEGGSAAVNLALRNPGVFGACASLSGEFRLSRGFGVKGVLGPEPGATKTLQDNSPLVYVDRIVEQAKKQVIYFNCGLDESDWLDQNREFDKKLTALGIPHTYREFPGGHGWGYWKEHLDDALRVVTAGMR